MMNDINKRIANLSLAKRKLLEQRLQQKVKEANRERTIPPRENPQFAPLSFAQERMWILDRLEPGNPAYNRPTNIRLTGSLHVAALEKAINFIVRRHEVLRTSFPMIDGQPVQESAPSMTVKLPLVELSHLPSKEREVEVDRIARSEAQQKFDLSKLPLIKAKLLRLGSEAHILLLTMHHIIFDGWSALILLEELAAHYEALVTVGPSPLAPLPIQYADFAIWQRQRLQGERLESQLAYWKKQLGGSLPVLELPTDRPRSPVQTCRGAKQYLLLPKNLSDSLKELSLREGVTLFMTLLAAFGILLYRYTGSEDLLVGTPVAGRDRAETEKAIGLFINTLVFRTHLDGNLSFRELLARVREVALEAYACQEVPFEQLVEALQPERDLSQTPIFQVLFQLRNLSSQVVEVQGLRIDNCQLETGMAMLDLGLEIEEQPTGLSCVFKYNSDLFDATTIERMAGHFQVLLSGIVANPQEQIYQFPLLAESERHQLLVEWNNTEIAYPQNKCIHQLFEEQVERTPDAVAVVFESEQLTYRQLNNRANQLAHYLRSLGVGPEVLVGICVDRSLERVVGLLGILKAGGAYVPLDPNYPPDHLAYIISDSQVRLLLTQSKSRDILPECEARVVCLDRDWPVISRYSQENLARVATSASLAYVIYTSGSTGRPKGVEIEHQSLTNFVQGAQTEYGIDKGDRVLQFASISFDAAAEEIYPCLVSGGTLVLRTDRMLSSVSTFMQTCREWGITVLDLPTAYWQQMMAELEYSVSGMLPSDLRLVIIGRERVLPVSVKNWQKLVGEYPQLVNSYGPTEATVVATLQKMTTSVTIQREVPIGRPLANVQTYILDRHLQPVPIGVPGELHIGGAGLARGYLNRPELTEQKFIPNPFSNSPGSRLYKTGDLARYLPDGNIEYIGRIDNQVKNRGFRIELGEIEAVLMQHPDIREAVVIARDALPGDKRLLAYVVWTGENADIITTNLRDFLKQKLPQYMIPNAFVVLDALPLTPNGKVDRRALPAPDTTRQSGVETFVAPRDSTELQLAQIWEQVLGIQPIGVTDNFFELGGHSLLAVRLVAEIEKVTQKKLPLAALFQFTTIGELARVLQLEVVADSANPNLSPELPPLDEDDLRALLTIVAGREGARPRPDSLMVAIRPTGLKPPLFYCASDFTEILTLARYLGEEQPLYLLEGGVTVVRRKGKRTEDDMKAIAARHLRDILAVHPEGPYLLTGYSFGKFVAYEVAKQLQERGKKVALLAILDGYGSGCIYCYLQKLKLTLMAMKKELFRGSLLSLARQLGSLSSVGANKGDYLLLGYPGKITLFVAKDVPLRQYKIHDWLFPAMGWEKHVIEIVRVPGDHFSMLTEPHVRVLADRLKACIDKALATEAQACPHAPSFDKL